MIAHIVAQRTEHKIPYAVSCRALEVSESWFYKHRKAEPAPAVQRRLELDAAVAEVFDAHDGEYGSPRVHAELIERLEWRRLNVKSVAESMRRQHLVAKAPRIRHCLTRPDKEAYKFENLLNRQFSPDAVNVAWVGDITEIKTWEGKLYLATVIDLYSRRLIGFAIADNCRAPLVCDALKMAIATRGGTANITGVIMHTDRGSQYTSHAFTKLCARQKITQSMSRAGSCLDNAVAESFFATLKTEVIYRTVLATRSQARRRVTTWIDRYNRIRRHCHYGLQPPITHETLSTPAATAA